MLQKYGSIFFFWSDYYGSNSALLNSGLGIQWARTRPLDCQGGMRPLRYGLSQWALVAIRYDCCNNSTTNEIKMLLYMKIRPYQITIPIGKSSMSGKKAASAVLSKEEEDLLARNTKKIKSDGREFTDTGRALVAYGDLGTLDPESDSAENGEGRSFRDTLLGTKGSSDVLSSDEDTSDDSDDSEDEYTSRASSDEGDEGVNEIMDGDDSGPTGKDEGIEFEDDPEDGIASTIVKISKNERKRMGKPLKFALVVKLLGRTIGFKFLEKKLCQLWARKGIISIVDMANDFFLVKFSAEDDFNRALTKGPWLIFDHYLSVRKWFPTFDPSKTPINSVCAWVRFPDLPFDCYDKKFLKCFGNKIGRTVKVDATTELQARGKYARVCVEIDLNKPLLSKYKLDGRTFFIEYESMHYICFKCGLYGHLSEKCNQSPEKKVAEEKVGEETADKMKAEKAAHVNASNGNINDKYDAWMTVQRTKRPRRNKATEHHTTNTSKHKVIGGDEGNGTRIENSRFHLLQVEEGTNRMETTINAQNDDAPTKCTLRTHVERLEAKKEVVSKKNSGPKPKDAHVDKNKKTSTFSGTHSGQHEKHLVKTTSMGKKAITGQPMLQLNNNGPIGPCLNNVDNCIHPIIHSVLSQDHDNGLASMDEDDGVLPTPKVGPDDGGSPKPPDPFLEAHILMETQDSFVPETALEVQGMDEEFYDHEDAIVVA